MGFYEKSFDDPEEIVEVWRDDRYKVMRYQLDSFFKIALINNNILDYFIQKLEKKIKSVLEDPLNNAYLWGGPGNEYRYTIESYMDENDRTSFGGPKEKFYVRITGITSTYV